MIYYRGMRVLRVFLVLGIMGVFIAALALLNNNFSARTLSREQFIRKRDHAAQSAREWVVAQTFTRRSGELFDLTDEGRSILANAALTHMLMDCAQLSGEQRLHDFASAYFRIVDHPYWFGRLVDPNSRFERPPDDYLRPVPNYVRWFLHATAPAEYSLPVHERADMFSPDKYRTGRATHQVFALYFYRKINGATPELDSLIDHISQRIAFEASIDFRVTDLYLQRIAVLLAVGRDLVKPRWVERALEAQQPDGGWRYTWHGWPPTPYRFQLDDDASTNHPTVQGMWLCYMLKYRYQKWVEKNYC